MQGDLILQDPPNRYLESTLHTSAKIDPKHPKVRPIVTKVVGSETDVLKKAQLVRSVLFCGAQCVLCVNASVCVCGVVWLGGMCF